jgi:hypothetical protein
MKLRKYWIESVPLDESADRTSSCRRALGRHRRNLIRADTTRSFDPEPATAAIIDPVSRPPGGGGGTAIAGGIRPTVPHPARSAVAAVAAAAVRGRISLEVMAGAPLGARPLEAYWSVRRFRADAPGLAEDPQLAPGPSPIGADLGPRPHAIAIGIGAQPTTAGCAVDRTITRRGQGRQRLSR